MTYFFVRHMIILKYKEDMYVMMNLQGLHVQLSNKSYFHQKI